MSNKDLLEELAEMGMESELIDRIRNWNDASPLRAAAKSAEKRAKDAEDRASQLSQIVMKSVFKDAGIKVNPALLHLPDDLDITSLDAVSKWAADNGLRDTTPSVDTEELESHEEINNLNSGGEPPSSSIITPLQAAEWSTDRSMKFARQHPEAWEQLKRGEEVRNLSPTQT